MVRLAKEEIEYLVKATHQCFGQTARIWLYGSRTDDRKGGGDIDLYIETYMNKHIVAATLDMRELIWKVFGDQKIDILVREHYREMSAMHVIAKDSGIELSI